MENLVFAFSQFHRGVRELTGGKVASLVRVWNRFFSAVEVVTCSQTKKFSILITTYSRLDKLSPDDATLPPVSCRTPQIHQLLFPAV